MGWNVSKARKARKRISVLCKIGGSKKIGYYRDKSESVRLKDGDEGLESDLPIYIVTSGKGPTAFVIAGIRSKSSCIEPRVCREYSNERKERAKMRKIVMQIRQSDEGNSSARK